MSDLMTEREGVRKLYLILFAGLTVIGGVMLVLTLKLTGPRLAPGNTTDIIGYVIAALAFAPFLMGVYWARGQVPARVPGESADEYWKPESRGRALMLWVLCEGSGILGAVGYHLTGGAAPLALFGLCWLAMVWYALSRLAGE